MKNRKINHLIMNFVSLQKYDLPTSCDKKVNCKIQILVNNALGTILNKLNPYGLSISLEYIHSILSTVQ